ncbi:asparagine synthase (glutamine-hydrolyzing) [Pseudoalteromonas sp. SK20]|uniref:asparagine synthase (glutamine-hydrolyzing) n=1 Tax=Pseudoalteromonas sp. SK20 TaxID=1938367 RepID=UPI000975D424|nr:asparagine synthase (glutamine-hydrolyzing) [Pseudoalteromonas sp. SK20]
MCGIVGSYHKELSLVENLHPLLEEIHHRGPDSSGVWSDNNAGINLGHARLSVVDLSEAGHQPMSSKEQRYVMVFNGEIYNHVELRKEIELTKPTHWKGHSDTETLLAGFEVWGLDITIQKCEGMFAIALWDKHTGLLHLIRDRLGEKPLYFGWQKDVFLFSSELKALKKHNSFQGGINRQAVALYFKYNYIPAPHSIYNDIYKLEAGHILTLDTNNDKTTEKKYWSAKDIALTVEKLNGYTETEIVNKLDLKIKESISQQMIADVPLGAFLSGGIDSSTVVSVMQSLSNKPIKTFTMGFDDEDFNEAEHAKEVAKHLRTDHHELYVSAQDSLNIIPKLPFIYDEPFADASQIPTFLVSQLAKQHVTVSLSGDAGDELFCGYNRYKMTQDMWGKLKKLPLPVRELLGQGLTSISPNTWDAIGRLPLLETRFSNLGQKVHKGASVLSSSSISELYINLVSNWEDPLSLVKGVEFLPDANIAQVKSLAGLSDVEKMMLWDIETYLADDILVKLDRASMAASLESRVPFLNHKVVEFAWQIPQRYKLKNGVSKWALRQVLYNYVPEDLIERPKKGFSLPLANWLRFELKDWAYSLIEPRKVEEQGFLNADVVYNKWLEHQNGSRDWSVQLWSVLMFQAWLREN